MSSKKDNLAEGFRKGLGKPKKRKTFGDLIDALTPDIDLGETLRSRLKKQKKKKKKPATEAEKAALKKKGEGIRKAFGGS